MSYFNKRVKRCELCGDEAQVVKYVDDTYGHLWLCEEHRERKEDNE